MAQPFRKLPTALALMALCAQFGLAHAQTTSDATSNYLLPSISLMKPDSDWSSSRTGSTFACIASSSLAKAPSCQTAAQFSS